MQTRISLRKGCAARCKRRHQPLNDSRIRRLGRKHRPGNTGSGPRFPARRHESPAMSSRVGVGRTDPQDKDTVMNDRAKPRILIVEDDADLRTILRIQLSDSGFEVVEATNGLEGFAQVQELDPDCVVLDLMMPVLDGFGFLKRVRSVSAYESLPVLMLTASEDERHRTRCFQFQADAYMSKPYNLEALTDQVHDLLVVPATGA